jgi:glutamate formiminotransferase / formiminotetrahydrofolate cyclodeaminase
MPSPLIECIPNFSEARRPEVVAQIVQAILSVPGIQILDKHSDLDHNRTVITYVGAPAAVEEAAFQAIAKASVCIDLNHHTGEHPRIGATDVVPFVPISETTMEECIEIARRLGKRVGAELKIPVFLYEDAATRPERQNLENIRRGQYEGLREEIKTNPERQPDFGPAALGSAGATVIGARQPLVAFNVYLTTEDTSIAQKIAKAVRNSSGGLHFVKAMGILVNGRAQVSMNLTNYRQTPVFRVVEMIRREALRYGVGIHHSELVGLIPQEALVDSAVWYLQLDEFQPEQILEQRLYDAQSSQTAAQAASTEPTFLDKLAAGTPTPGGGSAAAYSGASAAALVSMVARLTVGKKKYAGVEAQMWPLIDQAESLRAGLTQAIADDSAAFEAYLAAVRLPKNTPEEQAARAIQLDQATLHAAEVPLQTAQKTVEVLQLAVQVAQLGNANAISDAASAAALARAALTCAGLNVRINCQGLLDAAPAAPLLDRLAELEAQADQFERDVRAAFAERTGIKTA